MKRKYEVHTSEDVRRAAEDMVETMNDNAAERFISAKGRQRYRRAVAKAIRSLYWAADRIDAHDRGMAFAHADHKRRGGDP